MSTSNSPPPRPWALILAAWVVTLGFDVFLHAGVLARLYLEDTPFLLPAGSAFARIPLGYGAFLVLTVALWWLLRRVGATTWLDGGRMGLVAGLVVWGALCLGLFSISTAPPDLLLGWWVGQSAELALAGAVLGAGLGGMSRRSLYGKAAVAVIVCVVAALTLQALGWAPPMATT